MALQDDILNYKQKVLNEVTTQVDANSIPPEAVGDIGTDLADLLLPYLSRINKQNITGGSILPVGGAPDDIYFRSLLDRIEIHRNIDGNWVNVSYIPIGLSYPDGILLGLRTSINAYTITVSPGTWAINNIQYSKSTQTQLTIEQQNINYGRWDLIYANNQNQIMLTTGIASTTPAKPNIPIGSILVDYVYIPNIGVPFLLSGSNVATNISGAVVKSKTPISTDTKIINWQTDIVPNDTVTYAQKHGNDISEIKGFYDAGNGNMTPYEPNYSFNLNTDNSINLLTLEQLFSGFIIII